MGKKNDLQKKGSLGERLKGGLKSIFRKPDRKDVKRLVRNVLFIALGNFLFAVSVVFFIIPADLMATGSTGIALAINRLTGFSISLFVSLFNIFALILGLVCLGKKFFVSTILSSVLYPIFLEFLQRIVPEGFALTNDIVLNVIFAGLTLGASLGIVFRVGGSTGGMDVPTLVFAKYCKVPISVSVYIFDFLTILVQVFNGHTPEQILYSVILVFITTFTINKTSMLGVSKTEVKIISQKYSEIREAILTKLDRGVTLLKSESGFTRKSSKVVLSVMSNRELVNLENLVREIDPDCFMIVTGVKEVLGHGFSSDKSYLTMEEGDSIFSSAQHDDESLDESEAKVPVLQAETDTEE